MIGSPPFPLVIRPTQVTDDLASTYCSGGSGAVAGVTLAGYEQRLT